MDIRSKLPHLSRSQLLILSLFFLLGVVAATLLGFYRLRKNPLTSPKPSPPTDRKEFISREYGFSLTYPQWLEATDAYQPGEYDPLPNSKLDLILHDKQGNTIAIVKVVSMSFADLQERFINVEFSPFSLPSHQGTISGWKGMYGNRSVMYFFPWKDNQYLWVGGILENINSPTKTAMALVEDIVRSVESIPKR